VAALPPGKIEELRIHCLREFPTGVAVLLHFLTLGFFTTIYHGLKHSQLPMAAHDDFRAGKAIGFLFIPFFNIYWVFVFWLRLADRINLQFRLRGLPDAVSRGLVLTSIIFVVIGIIPILGLITATVAGFVLFPILSGQIQSACNRLVMMQMQRPQ
jgi:mannose/fructose/N-acetylgalactosamine-specific phosphotransferase system component IIC